MLQDGPAKDVANQIVQMLVTHEVSAYPEPVNVNLAGVAKLVRNKNALTNVQARLMVHVTRKLSNVLVKKVGLAMTAAKKHAQKTATVMVNAKLMVFACAKTCGLVKVVNSQLAQIHAVDMVCALVTSANVIQNTKAMIAQ